MASNRVSGLAAAFDPPAETKDEATAVTSIAARFDQPKVTSTPSDRVADLANRFGEKVDLSKPILPRAPKTNVTIPQKVQKAPVREGREAPVLRKLGTVDDISKKFSAPIERMESTSKFSEAASAFKRREAEEQKPLETRVSQFAKQIENGAEAPKVSKVGSVTRSFESANISAARTMFEVKQQKQEKEGEKESEKQTFADVSKRFEQGIVKRESKDEVEEEISASSASSASDRFKEAARMFGN